MVNKIGIDIGGTSIRAALISDGSIISFKKEATPKTPDEGTAVVHRFIREWLHETDSPVGIAAPGPLDTKTGIFLDPPNLPGWHGFQLKQKCEKLFGRECIVENDANAAAVAEYTFGAGVKADSMVYVTISTGVGAGIIAGGCLISGAFGNAGEVGNLIIADEGPVQPGLNQGSWESLASGTALGKMAEERLQLSGGAQELFKKIEDGSLEAEAVFAAWIDYTARGLANLVHTSDPEMIVLGGGVMNAADIILPRLEEALQRKVYQSAAGKIQLREAELGDYTGVIGAAELNAIKRL